MKLKRYVSILIIFALCAGTVFFSIWEIHIAENLRIENLLKQILPLFFCTPLILFYLLKSQKKIFSTCNNFICLLPCFLVAINNMPFIPWIKGTCTFAQVSIAKILLFVLYCTLVSTFEEFIFRGVLFPSLLSCFNKNKKGLINAMVLSSLFFGLVHILNLFSGAGVAETIIQVGYSTLIGGLCVFVFVKTYNILCSVLIHGVYNFCGLLFNSTIGLGNGVFFDTATVIITIIIGFSVGIFVIISISDGAFPSCDSLVYKKKMD